MLYDLKIVYFYKKLGTKNKILAFS